MWQCHVSSSECRCYRLKGFSLLKRFPLSAGAAGRLLDQPVGDWLEHVGLPQYESKLLLNGFDDLHYMVSASLHFHYCLWFIFNSLACLAVYFQFLSLWRLFFTFSLYSKVSYLHHRYLHYLVLGLTQCFNFSICSGDSTFQLSRCSLSSAPVR